MADDVERDSSSRGEGVFATQPTQASSALADIPSPPPRDAGFWEGAGGALRAGLGHGAWAGV
jgi:predicted lipid-binding transport protein (Tim44 family)